MLVISNGAFKSGSTWLFNILRCMTGFPAPPDEYLNPDWYNPSVHPKRLADLLKSLDYHSISYVSKNHFDRKRQRDLLLSYPDVFVLDMERDIRDVVVSAYYHHCRLAEFKGSFRSYYWNRGRNVVHRDRRYHLLWKVNCPNVYLSRYESLKSDFASETKSIGKLLGFDLSEQEIDAIQRETRLERLAEKYGQEVKKDGFFRKGTVGDWQNYFDQDMLEDIEEVKRKGLSYFERIVIKLSRGLKRLPPYRQWARR